MTAGRISGTKIPVTDGNIANLFVVLAKDGLYLVKAPVQAEVPPDPDPTRPAARVTFANNDAERLGDKDGLTAMQAVLDRAAVLIAFEQLGGADKCLEMAKSYALDRVAFGRQIGGYQAIDDYADIYVRNEVARSKTPTTAPGRSARRRPNCPLTAATARVAAWEGCWFASKENIQTHGGIGFTWEADPQLYYRRLRASSPSSPEPPRRQRRGSSVSSKPATRRNPSHSLLRSWWRRN
ncbi:acyl-CoA dehydrogenase family protein [Sphingomonas sp. MMS24-JH45]